MEAVLIRFIEVLRNAELRVSPAETIDAVNAVALVGYQQRSLLRNTLASVLAKSEFEKQRFDQCFDQFFKLDPFNWNDTQLQLSDSAAEQADATEQNSDGEGSGNCDDGSGDGSADSQAELQQTLDQNDIDASLQALAGPEAADQEQSAGASAHNDASNEVVSEASGVDDSNDTSMSTSLLGIMLAAMLNNDQARLAMQIQAAASANKLDTIRYATQRSLFRYRILQSLEINNIENVIKALQAGTVEARQQAGQLRQATVRLRDQVADHIDQQLILNADAASRQLREDILQNANLSRIEQRHFEAMQTLVQKMSKALVSRYARRRRIQRRGQLDVPKTIRHNMSHDGVLFDTYWKLKKKERPDIYAICDVSGSVAAYSRFLLLFLYSLADVLPKTRSFAFSSNLGEVTEMFREHSAARAIELVNQQWGYGSSSYGDSFRDFEALAMDDLRPSSTVIILGDGRNNGGNPELGILRKIYQRCASVIWLNPESRGSWSVGDSEMEKYLSAIHYANSCQSLRHLEMVISELLRRSS